MFRNVKISVKILIIMLVTSISALLIIGFISYSEMLNLTKYSQDANIKLGVTSSEESKVALEQQAEDYLGKIAVTYADNTNAIFANIAGDISSLAGYMENVYADEGNFKGHALPLPYETEAGVSSEKYMLAPGVALTDKIQSEVYLVSNSTYMFSVVHKKNQLIDNCYLGTASGISYRYSKQNLYNADYDPRQRGWYKQAVAKPDQPVWIDTYVDSYGKLGVTCAQTFRDSQGNIAGVVAVDIMLSNVINNILNIHIGDKGYAFMLDNKGKYIAHPSSGKQGFNDNPMLTAVGDYNETLEGMIAGRTGVQKASVDNVENYIAYSSLPATGWSIGIVVPIEDVIAASVATKAKIDKYTDEAQEHTYATIYDVLVRFVGLFAVCVMFFVAFSFVLANTITKPIIKLTDGVKKISNGEFDYTIAIDSKDEIGELADSFNKMGGNLKKYMQDLAKSISEKEKINSELTVAADIQNDMLPKIFPKYQHIEGLKIHAKMEPAKLVGGDFYDFFFVDETQDKFCMVIADVSGKGVPASLFMVIAKHIIKTSVLSGLPLAESVMKANRLLCEDNSMSMFVTAFVGIIDRSNGDFEYVSCGHNPPLLALDKKEFDFMTLPKSLPLAVMETVKYKSGKIRLKGSDMIFLYTDGVNEAINEQEELFGNEKFKKILNDNYGKSPEELDASVRAAISEFAGKAEQADDITTLVVEFTKKG